MKSILCIAFFSLGIGLGLSSTYAAEEINPRALDDANTPHNQDEKSSKDGKQKAIENATDQQADPNVTPSRHEQRNHAPSEQPRSKQERR